MHPKALLCLTLLALAGPARCLAADPPAPPCAAEARTQAKKLLRFHTENDDRVELDPELRRLPPLKNPANPTQLLQVVEVWGYVYKGQYRTRLIFHRTQDGHCLLLGQEVLEHASP
jgi:hypothetical protein